MKQALLILMFTFNISSAATQLTVEDGQILSEAYRYMSQVSLPAMMGCLSLEIFVREANLSILNT